MRARRIALPALAAGALAALAIATPVQATDYPDRPVTMIVPWGAGGGTDILVRALSPPIEPL